MTGPFPPAAPLLFPPGDPDEAVTGLVLAADGDGLPVISWLGVVPPGGFAEGFAAEAVACAGARTGTPLLDEHSRPSYRRPGLRGYRLGADATTGHDWSTAFALRDVRLDAGRLVVAAEDPGAGLALRTEIESMPGGALRIRHTVGNVGAGRYVVDGLELAVPVVDGATELLDFTGRHERERSAAAAADPRRPVAAREPARPDRAGVADDARRRPRRLRFRRRGGRPVHVAGSGNSVHWLEREPAPAP